MNDYDVDIYDDELVKQLEDTFGDDQDYKLQVTVHALHKYDLSQKHNNEESLIIQLIQNGQRLNWYEFYGVKSYGDLGLFRMIGEAAVWQNEYTFTELRPELSVIMTTNREDFAGLSTKDFQKLLREITAIPKRQARVIEVHGKSMKTYLLIVQQYLREVQSTLAPDFLNFYFVYKGWKMINLVQQQDSRNSRRALTDRTVDFSYYWKARLGRQSKDLFERLEYNDLLLTDLQKLEDHFRQQLAGSPTPEFTQRAEDYYVLVFQLLKLHGVNVDAVIEDFKASPNAAEAVIIHAYHRFASIQKPEYIPSPARVVKKLGISTSLAFNNHLEFLYLFTLSEGTRYRLIGNSTKRPVAMAKRKEQWRLGNARAGEKVWQLRVQGLTIKEAAKKLGVSRQTAAKRYRAYVEDTWKHKSTGAKSKLSNQQAFQKEMFLTPGKFDKWFGKQ
jgi:hypothetical protein